MTIKVNGTTIGEVMTNRSLTVDEALYAIGYDINDAVDCEKGYNDNIEGFYLDDCGNYRFDVEAVEFAN